MTTIAYKDGILAADSQATNGWTYFNRGKIRIINGSILAAAGTTSEWKLFMDWFAAGQPEDKRPHLESDMDLLQLTPDRKLIHWHCNLAGVELPPSVPFYAVGSGAGLAFGAFEMGANAVQAVEAAKKHDVYTGGPVHWVRAGEKTIHTKPPRSKVNHVASTASRTNRAGLRRNHRSR